jgi:hypothetical protein
VGLCLSSLAQVVDLYSTYCLLGYCLAPLVVFSVVAVLLPRRVSIVLFVPAAGRSPVRNPLIYTPLPGLPHRKC